MSRPVLLQYPGLTRKTTLSAPCGKARMALAFKNVDYELRNVTLPLQIKRYNARMRVPVLLFGDEAIPDSTDIVNELEQRYPNPPLEPADPRARAMARTLEDWADEVLYFYAVYLRWCYDENFERMNRECLSKLPIPVRWLVPLFARRQVRRRARGQGVGLKDAGTVLRETRECIGSLAAMLQGQPFLVGERLTRADVAVGALVDQVNLPQLTPQIVAMIDQHPEIGAWLGRVHEQLPNVALPSSSARSLAS